jgi:hypothetical protein
MDFEYRVVPAPKRLKKLRGATTEEAFATMLTEAINAEARRGWEYVGSETLAAQGPRSLFRRAVVVEETVLVFRRRRVAPHIAGTPHEVAPEPELRVPDPEARAAARREPEARLPNGNGAPEAPRIRPAAPRPKQGETPPSLLRPVPRYRPGEPS